MNLFTTLDPAVKKLLGWRMGDDEEKWALKAIESLVKKLRKRKSLGSAAGTLEDLEYALAHPGGHSRCVTIPRSLDGRLQVSHRKGLPHVIYCRVWRWPNLQSHHELRPIPACLYPYDAKQEHICINPYHYQRVEPPTFHNGLSPVSSTITNQRILPPPLVLQPSPPQQSASTCRKLPILEHQLQSMEHDGTQALSHDSPLQHAHNSTPSITPALSERQTSYSPTGSAFFSVKSGFSAASPSALSDDDEQLMLACTNEGNYPSAAGIRSVETTVAATFNATEPWCSVAYYELNSRVGPTFRVTAPNVIIDGGVDPGGGSGAMLQGYEERICLGPLSNVNRNNTIEATRRHIGKGTQLLLNNMSGGSMFLQSRIANFKLNLQPTAVCRVPTHSSLVMFDLQLFSNMLEKARCQSYHNVYELQKMCFVRLSFIKGWGADYHRQDITSTPVIPIRASLIVVGNNGMLISVKCWVEIQLHQPLSWIDSVLSTMEPPSHLNATSVS